MAEPANQARKLARASFGQAIATIWSAVLGFFTAPFLVHHLGAASYGVFALIGIITTYLFNLEFGFGHANMRFLAHARARGDLAEESAVIGNSMLIFLPFAAIGLLITFFGAPFIVSHLAHAPKHLRDTFVDAIRLSAFMFALNFLTTLWQASLQAFGRLRLIVVSTWLWGTAISVSSVTIALLGGGLVPILEAQLAIYVVLCLYLLGVLSRETTARLWPRLDRPTFRQMAGFASFNMLAGITSQVLFQGPALILAAYANTADLAALSVPRAVLSQLDAIVGSSSLGFMPFASAASADSDRTGVRAMYSSNLRLTIIVMAPVVTFLAAFAHPLLVAWIGASFAAKATGPLRLLAGASLFLGLGSPPADISRGFNRPNLLTAYTAVAAAATVGLSFLFIPSQHATGAALALCVGGALTTIPFLFVIASTILGLPAVELARALRGPAIGLACAGLVNGVGFLLSDTFLGAVVTGAVATSAYALIVWKLILNGQERRVLGSLVARIKVRQPRVDTSDAPE